MKLLIDAHTLIWSVGQVDLLSPSARNCFTEPANDIFISMATIWEIAIKTGLGKLSLSAPFKQWIVQGIADLNLEILPITIDHADRYTALPLHHRDPFDRLLIAQSFVENLSIVSADPKFDLYGVSRIW